MIGFGMRITDIGEFNRRAGIALRGVRLHSDYDLPPSLARQLSSSAALSAGDQEKVYRLVHRYRAQITDQMVLDYAANQAKGFS